MRALKSAVAVTLTAGLVAMAGAVLAGPAAAKPTADIGVNVDPQGKLYKDATRPIDLTLEVAVTPEPGAVTLKPMIKVLLKLPKGVVFQPHNNVTPVCNAVNEKTANVPPANAIALCPNSVVGDGRADLYIAQSTSALVTDPVITLFNRGKNNKGQARLGVHAYSISTNQGIYMSGTLRNRKLEVAIPRLAFDSSVPGFRFNIPGSKGQDQNYAAAKCGTGMWTSSAAVTLADRSATGGISNRQVINSPSFTQECTGKKGGKSGGGGGGGGNSGGGGGNKGGGGGGKKSPKLRGLKVGGPGAISTSGTFKYNVRVRNGGNRTMKKVRITNSGRYVKKRSARVAKVSKGRTRWFRVRVSLKGGAPAGATTTVKFKVNARGVKAQTAGKRILILGPGGIDGRG